jgi:crooked neck
LRYNEVDRARAVFERYVEVLPSVKAWVRYAKFELQHNDVARARSCYERAMEALWEDSHTVRVMHACFSARLRSFRTA